MMHACTEMAEDNKFPAGKHAGRREMVPFFAAAAAKVRMGGGGGRSRPARRALFIFVNTAWRVEPATRHGTT
jgi:hypothetical protein